MALSNYWRSLVQIKPLQPNQLLRGRRECNLGPEYYSRSFSFIGTWRLAFRAVFLSVSTTDSQTSKSDPCILFFVYEVTEQWRCSGGEAAWPQGPSFGSCGIHLIWKLGCSGRELNCDATDMDELARGNACRCISTISETNSARRAHRRGGTFCDQSP